MKPDEMDAVFAALASEPRLARMKYRLENAAIPIDRKKGGKRG